VTSFFPEPHEQQAAGPQVPGAGANGLVAAGSPLIRPAAPSTSRWTRSATTFGPVGRTVGTLVLLTVGVWLAIFALVGAAVWWFVVVPWALRDLWRPGRR
jgi:hypothetical protein